ncbi:uncharacterized protein TNIN_64291 [Trichonephila inaurata madagascariensis]|uniref:Uncharacterized protein n=1 Tax=Trichonephila inaurata madagascariensis TaxID=2747483 RepID=A0A8X6WMZ4_9ARAC|nr:uncharacterized protein TNIN_64291 [Trichonephila inaurata madagascariensis]
MPSDPTFQHLLEVFFPSSYMETSDLHRDLRKDITPKEHLKDLFDLIGDALAVLEISIHFAWSKPLSYDQFAMMQSVQRYVWNVMFLCWAEKEEVTDIYDRTLSVVALVKYTSEVISFTSGKNFYKLNSRILTVFFESCLREDFKKRGGWKRLRKHILSRKYREYHEECAAHLFVIKDIPHDLKRKIRLSFANMPKITEAPRERIDDLTREVMSSVGTSLLNELNSPKMNKDKSASKEAKRSSSDEANVLEDSDMCVLRSSEKQINICENHLNQLEEKLKGLISIFELLETEQVK